MCYLQKIWRIIFKKKIKFQITINTFGVFFPLCSLYNSFLFSIETILNIQFYVLLKPSHIVKNIISRQSAFPPNFAMINSNYGVKAYKYIQNLKSLSDLTKGLLYSQKINIKKQKPTKQTTDLSCLSLSTQQKSAFCSWLKSDSNVLQTGESAVPKQYVTCDAAKNRLSKTKTYDLIISFP